MTESMTPQQAPISKADRCDHCGAQAFVRAVFTSGELLFCAHHFAKYEIEITRQALAITDQREAINAKPSPAAY